MSIVRVLESVAERRPAAPAIVWRGTIWTYGELVRAATTVAGMLAARHIEPGSRVALLLRNSPHYVALYYGTLAAGCVAVPLNPQDRAPVLARQIAHSGSATLIGDPEHPEWAAVCAAVGHLAIEIQEVPLVEGTDSVPAFIRWTTDSVAAVTSPFLHTDDLATIIYTSGTTGRPKGVMLSHENIRSNALAIADYLRLTAADRVLCVLPFQFSYGSSVLHSHLLAGAELRIEENFAFPRATLQRIQDEAVTGFAGVPSTFALLLGRCRLQDFDLSRLRYVTQAGGAMPRALIERVRKEASATQLYIMYGQTEATARLTYLPPGQLDEKPGSVGIPIAGVEICIRDVAGARVEVGVTGEICVRGPNVMLGYWKDPAATEAVLGKDRWLRTGDLGHLDTDGYLYIDGRAGDMIKVGAFRVGPHEVEEVIAAIDGVEEVAVIGVPDEMLGQVVKAVIIRRAGAELAMLAVKDHCRRHLASYKVPKVVEFRTSLPRTTSGKVQRFNLA